MTGLEGKVCGAVELTANRDGEVAGFEPPVKARHSEPHHAHTRHVNSGGAARQRLVLVGYTVGSSGASMAYEHQHGVADYPAMALRVRVQRQLVRTSRLRF